MDTKKNDRVFTYTVIGEITCVVLMILGGIIIENTWLLASGFVLGMVSIIVTAHIYSEYWFFHLFSGLAMVVGVIYLIITLLLEGGFSWTTVLAGFGIAAGYVNLSVRNQPVF